MFTKLFLPVLMKYHPCTIEEVRHNIQKEKRIIDTLEPVMNSHRLIVHDAVIKKDLRYLTDASDTVENFRYSLFYQMTHVTKDRGCLKHDDALDALAMAVAYWVDSMGRDEFDALEAYKEQALMDELEKFMTEGLMVNRPHQTNQRWFTIG